MKIKEDAIKELDTLEPSELMMVYDIILSIKSKRPKYISKDRLPAYMKVRNALKRCKNSLSEDILQEREDRI
ncbi:MAG: hypothetical protein V1872_01245 [bacterium]